MRFGTPPTRVTIISSTIVGSQADLPIARPDALSLIGLTVADRSGRRRPHPGEYRGRRQKTREPPRESRRAPGTGDPLTGHVAPASPVSPVAPAAAVAQHVLAAACALPDPYAQRFASVRPGPYLCRADHAPQRPDRRDPDHGAHQRHSGDHARAPVCRPADRAGDLLSDPLDDPSDVPPGGPPGGPRAAGDLLQHPQFLQPAGLHRSDAIRSHQGSSRATDFGSPAPPALSKPPMQWTNLPAIQGRSRSTSFSWSSPFLERPAH